MIVTILFQAHVSPSVVLVKRTWKPSEKVSQPGGRGNAFDTFGRGSVRGLIIVGPPGGRDSDLRPRASGEPVVGNPANPNRGTVRNIGVTTSPRKETVSCEMDPYIMEC